MSIIRQSTALGATLALYLFVRASGGFENPSERTGEPVFSSPRLLALHAALQRGDKAALGNFWKEVKGKTPLVEPLDKESDYLVTYLWRGDQQNLRVYLIGGVPLDTAKALARLPGTDLWYWTERLPRDARYSYLFLVGTKEGKPFDRRNDPLGRMEYDEQSIVELPGAPPQPWSEPLDGVRHGKRAAHKIHSAVLNSDRDITVYTPPDYDPKSRDFGLLLVLDGESAGGDLKGFNPIPGHIIVDNLIGRNKIAPVVAVFLDSGTTRDKDFGCSDAFTAFLAQELVPWVRERYPISKVPSRSVVTGVSRGGLAAAYCGLRHSQLFGNVLVLSGAFWWYPEADQDRKTRRQGPERLFDRETGWLTRQFAHEGRKLVRFYLEAGKLETGGWASIRFESRRLRDVLEAKGYQVIYHEYTGGHDYACWRGAFADGLIALLDHTK
jgi:enterochelin esterase family protein